MRICITRSTRFAYSETFIRDQIKVFSKWAEVYPIHSGRLPERKEDGSLLSPLHFWYLHKVVKLFAGRNNYFGNYGVKQFLKDNNIEVVLSNYGISAVHLLPVCRQLKIPLLPIFHGHDATDRKLLHQYENRYKRLFRHVPFIIVVSEDMKTRVVDLGATAEKVKVIPCGVDTTKFKPVDISNSTKQNFLTVGRFSHKKGPTFTIRAFTQVLREFPEATLTMVGKKEGLYNDCFRLVKDLGIEKSVIFTGVLSPEQIAGLAAKSIAFVLHSVTAPNGDMEGTPVSIMEAAACGLPVVSTLHGGIKDVVVHQNTGFLVKEKDVDAMADYMKTILENSERAAKMGLKGREHIQQNYHQEKQVRKLYDLALKAIELK